MGSIPIHLFVDILGDFIFLISYLIDTAADLVVYEIMVSV